jgi:hypothetical protein
MSTIVTRAGKGSALTFDQVDANFTNLNNDKIQSGNTVAALTIINATLTSATITGLTSPLPVTSGGTGASTPEGARANLGLGTNYATAAQGAKADTALQPSNIGTTVQAYSSNLSSIAFDANGNIIANILPRTNTLAGLIALQATGRGELSSATDVPAIVQFNGAASSGVAAVYSPMSPGVWEDSTNTLRPKTGTTSELQITGITNGTGSSANVAISGANATTEVQAGSVSIKGGTNSTGTAVNGRVNGDIIIEIPFSGNTNPVGQGTLYLRAAGGSEVISMSSLAALTSSPNDILTPIVGFFGRSYAPCQGPAYINASIASPNTMTAVGGAAVTADNTFNGGGDNNSGYTIGQIVRALKNYGLLAE